MAKKKADVTSDPPTTPPGNAVEAPAGNQAVPGNASNGTAGAQPGEKKKPAFSMQLLSDRTTQLEVAVWENFIESSDGGWIQHSLTLARFYKDGEQWKPSKSYRTHDLPILLFLIQKAHTWILEQRAEIPF